MNPENKKFLETFIDKLPVSVTTDDDIVMYHVMMPDGKPLLICAETTPLEPTGATIYYTVILGEDLLEEATIDTRKKEINPVAKDIIQIMRKCSTKIMMQEAHLAHTKFMSHMVPNKKTYS